MQNITERLRKLVGYHGDPAYVHRISNSIFRNTRNQPQKDRILGHSFDHVYGKKNKISSKSKNHVKSQFMSEEDMYILTDAILQLPRAQEAMEILSCYKDTSIKLVIDIDELNIPKIMNAILSDGTKNTKKEQWPIKYILIILAPYFNNQCIIQNRCLNKSYDSEDSLHSLDDDDDDDNNNDDAPLASIGIITMYPLRPSEYDIDGKLNEIITVSTIGAKRIPWELRSEYLEKMNLRNIKDYLKITNK